MSVTAASIVARALAMGGRNYPQDLCLTFTYECMGSPATGIPGGSFGSAVEAFSRLRSTPRLDWANAPAGAVHWWAAKYPGDPGHVAPGIGGGRAVSTNAYQRATGTVYAQGKVRNTATIGARTIPELSSGRGRYLGWTLEAFNNTITTTAPAGQTGTPIMATLDADDIDNIKNAVIGALVDAKGSDGRNLFDSVLQTRSELKDRASEGAKAALVQQRGSDGRNIFDSVLQTRAELRDRATEGARAALKDAPVRVELPEGAQVGYAPSEVADELARRLQS